MQAQFSQKENKKRSEGISTVVYMQPIKSHLPGNINQSNNERFH